MIRDIERNNDIFTTVINADQLNFSPDEGIQERLRNMVQLLGIRKQKPSWYKALRLPSFTEFRMIGLRAGLLSMVLILSLFFFRVSMNSPKENSPQIVADTSFCDTIVTCPTTVLN